MWLIETETMKMQDILNINTHRYAILSHTCEEEADFQEMMLHRDLARQKKGYAKIEKTCQLARERGIGSPAEFRSCGNIEHDEEDLNDEEGDKDFTLTNNGMRMNRFLAVNLESDLVRDAILGLGCNVKRPAGNSVQHIGIRLMKVRGNPSLVQVQPTDVFSTPDREFFSGKASTLVHSQTHTAHRRVQTRDATPISLLLQFSSSRRLEHDKPTGETICPLGPSHFDIPHRNPTSVKYNKKYTALAQYEDEAWGHRVHRKENTDFCYWFETKTPNSHENRQGIGRVEIYVKEKLPSPGGGDDSKVGEGTRNNDK
ncbi:hypothetical protein B0H66DRAFT_595589 [Apodospora peruviana]|uniref:Uncharacterized protein n=1 Tax=Apodospora peruviana TaxID=516989 RepID=A0AAE0HUH9_9PEZI|nr:hypothetical protein B0H66DRAFT_595589 [Apodospora peruviana]